ncbi:MAG: UDP-N-acetylmuramate dehydrogenase [Clostridia bacterium]|nr:UDP-N-acetylmuramate dehydrogenase [Clostridia bacterium]
MISRFEDVLKQQDLSYRTNISTATLCSFRIGGLAPIVIEPLCLHELIRAVELCDDAGVPFSVIGKGSNVLFDDSPLDRVLIRTVKLDAIQAMGNGELRVLCGTALPALVVKAARQGLAGFTWAAGIPGTVGGGIWMNAGAYGKSMENAVKSVENFDRKERKIKTLFNKELGFPYRNSRFQSDNCLILSAVLAVTPNADFQELQREINRYQKYRRDTQPLEYPNAGSTFRRPSPERPLAPILEELGLKGMTVGGASISHKHAGFIVNAGNATAADVRRLIFEIQNIVERERGFRPIPEICMIPQKHYELFADTQK